MFVYGEGCMFFIDLVIEEIYGEFLVFEFGDVDVVYVVVFVVFLFWCDMMLVEW